MKWSIAFALIGVVTLLAVFARVDNESPTRAVPQALVEVEINELLLTRYDDEGNRLEQSSAAHAIQLENQSTTDLSDLEVRRRDRQGQEWVLISPSGTSDMSNDTMKLEGGVVVSRADGVNLLTETVVVDIASGRAISTDKTQLTSNQSSSASDGLVIDLEQGTAELLGQVRSTYQRSSRRHDIRDTAHDRPLSLSRSVWDRAVLAADTDQPIEISADSAMREEPSGKTTYRGDVVLTRQPGIRAIA